MPKYRVHVSKSTTLFATAEIEAFSKAAVRDIVNRQLQNGQFDFTDGVATEEATIHQVHRQPDSNAANHRLLALVDGGAAWSDSKEEFHTLGKSVLRKLATDLGLKPGDYAVRSNRGGSAVIGEVTLHGENIYVQAGGDTTSDLGILVRSCKGQYDYTGGPNRWVGWHELKTWPGFVKAVQVAVSQV